MNRPTKVEAMGGYKIRLSYPDGMQGVLDLSDQVGKGIFAPLKDEKNFQKVHLGPYGQIAWSDEMEICPDAAYLEITGKVRRAMAHA
jgi:hypothetical protein